MKPSIAPDLEAWRALLPRVAPPLSDDVDYTIARAVSGYHGEQSLEYPLSLISPDHDIYYDLRLPHGDSFFQIDCLLVSECCFVVLEVKNHRGVLTFDTEHQQLLREWEGVVDVFDDPVLQVRRHRMQFLEWFGSSVPCDTFVVVSNRKARIEGDLPSEVLRPSSLLFYIGDKYKEYCIDKVALRERLLKAHQPLEVDVMKRMKLQPRDILPGVRCLDCGSLKMRRVRTVWHCSCGAFDKKAHLAALRDYKLLFGEQITNRQARWFLQMDDAQAVKYYLNKYSYKSEGPNKKKIYFLR